MSALKEKQAEQLTFAFVMFATLLGLFIRLAAPLQASFPLNDGGLFYVMIRDIQHNGYALPTNTVYNNANLLFAYPPLAFYLTGLLADFTHIELLDLLRLLPAIISGLCIPAFYLLARQLMASRTQVILSTFAFALLPRTSDWLIMGGGITRSFGLLFALLTMLYAYKLYASHDRRAILFCILFGTMVVLTHPEATIHTAITALVFFFLKDRSWKGLLMSLGVAASISALSAPWWGSILSRHGPDPFLASLNAARQNSFNQLIGLVVFFRFLFADEPYLSVLSTIGAIGLFASLNRKQGLLPCWLFVLHFSEPRGGTLYMMIPLALLVGVGLEAVILPGLKAIESENEQNTNKADITTSQLGFSPSLGKTGRTFLIVLFAYTVFSAYGIGFRIYQDFTLKPEDLETFVWTRQNTPEDSQFLLVTGQLPLRDAWSEWFPVLAERHSQATVFGYEWVNDGKFGERVKAYEKLQQCAYENVACLEKWNQGSIEGSSFIYLFNRAGPTRFPLTVHLQQDSNYKLVFQNERTMIFEKSR